MMFMIIAQNMHYFQKIIFQRMHQNVLQRFYKSKTQLMIFTKSNNLLLSWFWVLKMFVKRLFAKNWLSPKISQNLHNPVDGRTCLIDRPIDRPASTDKSERKNVCSVDGPGQWVKGGDRPREVLCLKNFQIFLSLQYPVDPSGRSQGKDDRPTPSTDPCLTALNALAVYTHCKGFSYTSHAYLMLIDLRYFDKLQALNFIIYYKL